MIRYFKPCVLISLIILYFSIVSICISVIINSFVDNGVYFDNIEVLNKKVVNKSDYSNIDYKIGYYAHSKVKYYLINNIYDFNYQCMVNDTQCINNITIKHKYNYDGYQYVMYKSNNYTFYGLSNVQYTYPDGFLTDLLFVFLAFLFFAALVLVTYTIYYGFEYKQLNDILHNRNMYLIICYLFGLVFFTLIYTLCNIPNIEKVERNTVHDTDIIVINKTLTTNQNIVYVDYNIGYIYENITYLLDNHPNNFTYTCNVNNKSCINTIRINDEYTYDYANVSYDKVFFLLKHKILYGLLPTTYTKSKHDYNPLFLEGLFVTIIIFSILYINVSIFYMFKYFSSVRMSFRRHAEDIRLI
jgi:hypothetical protein